MQLNATKTSGKMVKRAVDNSTFAGMNMTQLLLAHGIKSNNSKLMQRLAARFNVSSMNISSLNETDLQRPQRAVANATVEAPANLKKNLTAALNESVKDDKKSERSILPPLANMTSDASSLLHSLPSLVSNATASASASLHSLPSRVVNATVSASALVSNVTANVTSWVKKIINGDETTGAVNETSRFVRASIRNNSTLKHANSTRHNATHHIVKNDKVNHTDSLLLANDKQSVNLTLDDVTPAVNISSPDFKRTATNLTLDPAVKSNVTTTANSTLKKDDVPAVVKLNSTLIRARRQEPTVEDISTRSRYGVQPLPPAYNNVYPTTTTTMAPPAQYGQYAAPQQAVPAYVAQTYNVPAASYQQPQQQQTYPAPMPVSESYYTAPPAPVTAAPYVIKFFF